MQKPVFIFPKICTLAIAAIVSITASGSVHAQAVDAGLGRDTLQTGDIFEYHVVIGNLAAYDAVIYPDSASFAPDFIIRDVHSEHENAGKRRTYTLHFFGVDVEAVPEIPVGMVAGTDTLYTTLPRQPFVYEPRVDDAESALRPLKPIFPFFRSWWPYIIVIMILILLASYLLYRYREKFFARQASAPKSQPVKSEPFRSPLWRLRIELKRIEDTHKDPVSSPVPYFTELGDAFRTYIEEVHGYPAMESTTSELLYYLKSLRFDGEVVRLLGFILEKADLVKFARFEPNETDCSDVMKFSSALADRMTRTDREILEELRRKHEEEQNKLLEETSDDLG